MTDYQQLAQRLKLLAHPERLRMLDVLRRSPECVCHLEALLGRPQPYISQQLRMLSRAGIIKGRREGSNVYYHVIDTDILAWLTLILGPVPVESRHRHEAVANCSCPKCQHQPVILVK
ncbi:MAG: ArsR family transcriptional regulator [Chloroflexi bacterium]|nr:MAG: ArsR family transcriptional regulator [Chloroflexota bacterium]